MPGESNLYLQMSLTRKLLLSKQSIRENVMHTFRPGSQIMDLIFRVRDRDVTTRKIYPPGLNRVKVSENLGATPVALVAPVVISLHET